MRTFLPGQEDKTKLPRLEVAFPLNRGTAGIVAFMGGTSVTRLYRSVPEVADKTKLGCELGHRRRSVGRKLAFRSKIRSARTATVSGGMRGEMLRVALGSVDRVALPSAEMATNLIGWLRLVLTAIPFARNMPGGGGGGAAEGATSTSWITRGDEAAEPVSADVFAVVAPIETGSPWSRSARTCSAAAIPALGTRASKDVALVVRTGCARETLAARGVKPVLAEIPSRAGEFVAEGDFSPEGLRKIKSEGCDLEVPWICEIGSGVGGTQVSRGASARPGSLCCWFAFTVEMGTNGAWIAPDAMDRLSEL